MNYQAYISANPIPPYYITFLDMRSDRFAQEARSLFDLAIKPSCEEIQRQLDVIDRYADDETLDRWEALRNVQMDLHRTFALGLGALWERAIRENMRAAAYILCKPITSSLMKKVNGGGWSEIEQAFQNIRGFPLSWFPMHSELGTLHKLSSAVRHGDGDAAKALRKADPSLFRHHVVETSFYSYFAYGGYDDAAVRKLDITLDDLHRFAEAVAGFWIWMDHLRTTVGYTEASSPSAPT